MIDDNLEALSSKLRSCNLCIARQVELAQWTLLSNRSGYLQGDEHDGLQAV